MVHNQVQFDNHQRRIFLWVPKNKVLTSVGMVGHQFDPQGKHIVLSCFDSTMMADCIDDAKLEYKDGNKDPDI